MGFFFPQSSKKYHFNIVHHKGASVFRGMVWGGPNSGVSGLKSQCTSNTLNPREQILKHCLIQKLSLSSANRSLSVPGKEGSLLNECQHAGSECPEHSVVTEIAAETSSVYSECDSGHLAASLLFSVVRIPRNISLEHYDAEEKE